MIIEGTDKNSRLDFFSSLYESAKNSFCETLSDLERYMLQYKGDKAIDGSSESAVTTRNITYEIIESQISSEIPMPKVDAPYYSERKVRCATAIERLLSAVRDRLPYEELNDIDERYTYIYGGSVWYLEWDSSEKRGKETGSVRLYCLPPTSFIPEPGIGNVKDMEYCFLRFCTTRGELMRRYGLSAEELSLAEGDNGDISEDSDLTFLTVCFYRDEEGQVGKYVFSGDLQILDLPAYYRRKKRVCTICKREEADCGCKKPKLRLYDQQTEELYGAISLLNGEVVPTFRSKADGKEASGAQVSVPYYTPKSFPIVVRKNTSLDDTFLGQSDCEYIRPEQQAINKIESRILQKLLRSGITPIMPEDASISLNNSVFGQVIKMKPGESAAQYGKVDTTPDISQDIAEAERLYEHSKRILGISDALQGLDSSSGDSGYARQLKISQATGRLESKRKMKHTAYASIDRLIFEHYLAFADEPRALIYRDAYGRLHNTEFNRYDFIEYDTGTGDYYYDDGFLFSVDLNGGAEYQREALWERNLENLKAGTLGDPADPVTLLRYWQCQERAHYPNARENVEYFTNALREDQTGGVINEEKNLWQLY